MAENKKGVSSQIKEVAQEVAAHPLRAPKAVAVFVGDIFTEDHNPPGTINPAIGKYLTPNLERGREEISRMPDFLTSMILINGSALVAGVTYAVLTHVVTGAADIATPSNIFTKIAIASPFASAIPQTPEAARKARRVLRGKPEP